MLSADPFQEQVARLRRAQILDAAVLVFAERGFHRTTIREVARAAGVADGTIYNYFENKTALLLAILELLNETEQRDTDLGKIVTGDIRAFCRHYFAQRWDLLAGKNLNILRVVLSEVLVNPELRELYLERIIAPTFALAEPYFEQLVAAGKLRPINVPLALRAIAATFLGLLITQLLGDPMLQSQAADIPELLTTLFLDGILPKEGEAHGSI